MSYKLIVSDLDGTLLDSRFKISEINAEAVRQAMASGCVFTIASGRPVYSVLPIAKALGMDASQFVICFNGAVIAESGTGRVISKTPLSHVDALHIVKNAKNKGASVIAYIDGVPYTHFENDDTRGYVKQVGVSITVNESFEDIYDGEYDKIIMRGASEHLKKIEAELSGWAMEKVAYTYSSPVLLEYYNISASKGTAMLTLAERLKISLKDIIAIGDYYNDLTMLEAAGLGVAVNGSPNRVIEEAGYVTERTASDGAVAEVIERFVLL